MAKEEVTRDPKTGKIDRVVLDHAVDADHPEAVSITEDRSKLDALGALGEPSPEEVFAAAEKPAPKK